MKTREQKVSAGFSGGEGHWNTCVHFVGGRFRDSIPIFKDISRTKNHLSAFFFFFFFQCA